MIPANQEKAMKMRGTLPVMLVLALGLALPPAGFADDTAKKDEAAKKGPQTPPSSTRPPKHLHKEADGHWTAWNPPTPPAGANVHTVVPGDTLWGLAGANLKNPYLWPQIWDQNRYVTDSHWIYPGDPITVPTPEVVPPEGAAQAPAAAPAAPEGEQAAAPPEAAPAAPAPAPPPPVEYPIGDRQDVYCAAYVTTESLARDPQIVASEDKAQVSFAQGSIVYINGGTADGLKPGDRFTILRDGGVVKHLVTGQELGRRVDQLGWLSLIAVQEKGSTAEITFSCEDVRKGDVLVPFKVITVPTTTQPIGGSRIDRYNPTSSGKSAGYLVVSKDPQGALASGNIVNVDLGQASGVKPGDILSIYRPNPAGEDLPRINLGEGVVLMTGSSTSVVKITASVREIYLGDRVEMR